MNVLKLDLHFIRFWTAVCINVFFLRQSKPINCIKQLQHKVTVINILLVPLLLSLFIFYNDELDKVKSENFKHIKVVIIYFSYLKQTLNPSDDDSQA